MSVISHDNLDSLIEEMESILSKVYRFEKLASVRDHLISSNEATELSGQANPNASVYAFNDSEQEDFFIGIHFPEKILNNMVDTNPLESLREENLNAFMIFIEELSHFHLILNRLADKRVVSRVELEWQGEVDKLLLAALLLNRQYGDNHYFQLAHKLFESSQYTTTEEHYREANKYAAIFWYRLLTYEDGIWDPENSQKLHHILMEFYQKDWQTKVRDIETRYSRSNRYG